MIIYRLFARIYAPFLLCLLILLAIGPFPVGAAPQLSQRSVRLETSRASANTSHIFNFTFMNPDTVGSIKFEYCANNPFVGSSCTVPLGLSLSGAVLSSQLGAAGFIIDPSSNNNTLILSRAPAAVAPGPVEYVFSNVVNPNSVGSYYVRLSTYASSDVSGPYNNEGGIVYAIAQPLDSTAFVPPFLTFCVGITVANDCTASAGAYANLGELSTSSPRTSTSQFAGATNDPAGYSVSLSGKTMTSGNNIITALASPTVSIPGTSQFGLNLRANSNPLAGQNPTGIGTLAPTANFNSPNQFVFLDGAVIATSPLPTEFNTMTVTYMVNISSSQPPGVYNSTATYIATAAF